MAAPLLVPLILLGGATIALAAASSKKKRPSGNVQTYTLDQNIPASLRDQVLAALATEQDPSKLEAFAAAIAPAYPLSAAALRQKASMLRAGTLPQNPIDLLASVPDPPRTQVVQQLTSQNDPNALEAYAKQLEVQYPAAAAALRMKEALLRGQPPQVLPPTPTPPVPTPPPINPQPQPSPAPAPTPTPSPDWQTALLTVPDPPRTQVVQAMMTQSDPNALEAYARQLDGQYPLAAWALRVKEATLLGQAPPPMPSIGPMPPSPAPAPVPVPTPSPTPVPAPSYLGGLDPGMPAEMQKAVVGALTTETDPAKLEGFASAIQGQYPVSAGLLMAKAQALRLANPVPRPSPSPSPAPGPGPQPTPVGPSPSPMPPPGAYPVGDASTRSGRNAARPTGYPFILIRPTDSTYPAKIAKQATGSEANYRSMTPLNPHVAPGGKWIGLIAGDALNVPWDWAPKLAGSYLLEVDPPGAAPVAAARPALAGAAIASLPPAGGTHAAHA